MRILHLEDNPSDAELIRAVIAQELGDCHLHMVADRSAYLAALQQGGFDVILSDYSLPEFDGLEALTLAREHSPETPFVFCSGSIGEDSAIAALQAGAADYVLKDRLTRLGPVLRRVLQETAERMARLAAENSLQLSHERFDLVARATNDILWDWDILTDRIWRSEAFHRFFGHAPGERCGTVSSWPELIHPDDIARVTTGLRHALDHGRESWSDEYRFRRADGTYGDVLDRGYIQRDADGRAVRMLGSMQDITARKAAEAGLRDREARLRAIIDNEPACVKLVGADGTLLDMNPAGLAMLDAESPDQVKGRNIYAYIPIKAERDGYESLIHRAFQGDTGRRVFTVATLRGRRRILESHVSPMRDAEGRILAALSLTHDITNRRKDEARLRQQADIIERAPVAIFMTDLDQRVTYSNAGAAALCGLKPGEMLGRRTDELFSPRAMEHLAAGRKETLRTGQWRGEVPLETREGRRLTAEFILSLIRDESGQPTGHLKIATDITEKKQLEEQVLRTQRLENLGLLAAGIAHDLNNILAPVLMISQLLRARLPGSAEQKLVDTLEESANRGASLVKQIIGFAQGTGGERAPLQAKHLARDVVAFIEDTFPRSITISAHIASDLWTVRANATQLHQLLLNFCVNARDAMPNGGTLHLTLENSHLGPAAAASLPGGRPGSFIHLCVADTGHGIPSDILPRIWEPFFTTKEAGKGTGLGLSTVRGIVTAHGGFCHAVNAPNSGAEFHVYLPAEGVSVNSNSPVPPKRVPRGSGEVILLVDDEAAVRDTVEAALIEYGYRVHVAADGMEAITLLEALETPPHVVVSDLNMPWLGGLPFIRFLRRFHPSSRVLVISGSDSLSPIAATHGDAHLKKPFQIEDLLQTIHQLLPADNP
ncbi:MAG: histidine kinase [Opitutus sp.]|nr:histidine kinase [Opitutus sp.]